MLNVHIDTFFQVQDSFRTAIKNSFSAFTDNNTQQ